MKTFLTLLIFDKIGETIIKSLRTLMMAICELVYKLIVFCFDVFENLGTAKIVSDVAVSGIFNKISLILGIFMVFRLTFAAIQYIIDPDLMTDKNKGAGNIIKKVIITIVLLGSVNYIFKMAYDIQNYINEDNVLGRVLLGDLDSKYKNEPGKMVANNLFKTFFRINEDIANKNDFEVDIIEASGGVDFTPIYRELNETGRNTKTNEEEFAYKMDGYGFGTLAIGLAGLYVIFMFTIQVAVRLFQLAYLQMIAPIPIMMYITPKGDEQLKKWGQQCLTTFLDFFIRTAIIYFAIYLIGTIVADKENITSSMSGIWTGEVEKDAYILGILIIGALMFAKKVPNLLKEIFPSLGGTAGFSYDISGKAFKDTMKLAYNATPIGWGLHAAKWTAQGIDRKAHGKKFFGPGRLRKKIDEMLPEQAKVRKEREEAIEARNLFEKQERMGEELFNRRSDHKIDESFFKNQAFKDSWRKLKDAKDAEDLANEELKAENARYQAAFNSGDQREIAIAKSRVATAEKNLKVASGAVEKAQEFHDKNRAIYTKDREIEDRYTRYKKTHGTPEVYKTDAEILSEAGIGNIANTDTENSQSANNRIIVEEHVQSQPRQETTSQETVQNEHSRLVEQYNNETDPSKKAAIRKQIDNLEKRH